MTEEEQKQYRVEFARSGGNACKEKYGVEFYKKLSEKAVKARKKNETNKQRAN